MTISAKPFNKKCSSINENTEQNPLQPVIAPPQQLNEKNLYLFDK